MLINYTNPSDYKKFRNRLSALMLQHNPPYKTARALATALYDLDCDNGLKYHLAKFNENAETFKRRSNAIGSIEKQVAKHLNHDDVDILKGNFVLAYCDLFQCSPDFLFGYTNIMTNVPYVRTFCEKTYLSEDSVQVLLNLTGSETCSWLARDNAFIVNSILLCNEFKDFVFELNSLDSFVSQFYATTTSLERNLTKKFDLTTLDEAYKIEDKLDEIYTGPLPPEKIMEAVRAIWDINSQYDTIYENYQNQICVYKYNLNEIYVLWINKILEIFEKKAQNNLGDSAL